MATFFLSDLRLAADAVLIFNVKVKPSEEPKEVLTTPVFFYTEWQKYLHSPESSSFIFTRPVKDKRTSIMKKAGNTLFPAFFIIEIERYFIFDNFSFQIHCNLRVRVL